MNNNKKLFDVPFVEDKRVASCQGPSCTMMALKFFKPNLEITMDELFKIMKYKFGHWFFETYIVRGLDQCGVKAIYYSNKALKKINKNSTILEKMIGIGINDPKLSEEIDLDSYDSSVDYTESRKLFKLKKIDSYEKIIPFIDEGKLVIALVNRNTLTKTKGDYKGHFTLIVGYDKSGFYLNDPFIGKNHKISFELFNKVFYYTDKLDKEPYYNLVVIG